MTPMRLTLIAAALVYLHGLLVHRHPYFGVAGTLCLAAAGLGDSPETIAQNVTSAGDKTSKSLWRLVPSTVTGWGLVSVAASFVLLAIGMVVSLLKPIHKPVIEEVLKESTTTDYA